jgi:hypothetical protein
MNSFPILKQLLLNLNLKLKSNFRILFSWRNRRIEARLSHLPHSSLYKINGTSNLDTNTCFKLSSTYPNFQKEIVDFKNLLRKLYAENIGASFYKFGDGDYYFLKGIAVGSAKPGNRALSKTLSRSELKVYSKSARRADYYLCEIYPENRSKFARVIQNRKIDYPSEFVYGLIANKWIFENFGDSIGIIGADAKVDLIRKLMDRKEYRDYLGIQKFSDYIKIPQKFACDDLDRRNSELESQLNSAKSKLFLVGIGHLKSGVLYKLPSFHRAIYLDVGSGIDAIAGVIDEKRPYFGDWINHKLNDGFDYKKIDLLQYSNCKTEILY